LPDKLKDRRYYLPSERGQEKEIGERMKAKTTKKTPNEELKMKDDKKK
jgi:hypothetical protein